MAAPWSRSRMRSSSLRGQRFHTMPSTPTLAPYYRQYRRWMSPMHQHRGLCWLGTFHRLLHHQAVACLGPGAQSHQAFAQTGFLTLSEFLEHIVPLAIEFVTSIQNGTLASLSRLCGRRQAFPKQRLSGSRGQSRRRGLRLGHRQCGFPRSLLGCT